MAIVADLWERRAVTWGQGACLICERGTRWLYEVGSGRLIICGPCLSAISDARDELDIERIQAMRAARG
jgi:hypothetical protein